MKKYVIIVTAIVVISVIYFVNFKHVSSPTAISGKIKVISSFYPMYYFSRQIAGDKADVTNITPAGAEPHDYEPTAREIVGIEQSDLLILNGGSLEAWGDKIKNQIMNGRPLVIVAGENLANKQLVENGQTIRDPHVWLSPELAKQEVENILQGFIRIDPAHSVMYQSNAQTVENRLDSLDQEYSRSLSLCAKQDIVTSHAAFGYLADRYHFNQVNITGISPDQEPSTQKLAEISDLVKKQGIKYIFFESLISPKLSETIANETGAQTLVLDPVEGLSNQDIQNGKDYFTQMQTNLSNLKLALECRS
jgi:zinc transport system substrate-binding protein